MNCSESEVLIHALLDGELDAGHAHEVEAHLTGCSNCSAKLAMFREMRQAMSETNLAESAPAHLRQRIEAAVASAAKPQTSPAPSLAARLKFWPRVRRSFFGGFAAGAVLSAAAAAILFIAVVHDDQAQRIAGDVVSAHLRSLQAGHLTDVETSDRHTVKPWFNGRLDVSPPVVDLSAEGFALVGGRLDEVNGETTAAVVYRRRQHLINVFVARHLGHNLGETSEARHGFNVRHWTQSGLDFWAVSDINTAELNEFCQSFAAAM